jgi:hypothetical protein
MPYYVRVLSTSADSPTSEEIQDAIRSIDPGAQLLIEDGESAAWGQLLVSHADGTEIAVIERCPVAAESVALAELEEFRDEIADEKPASAVAWLLTFLDRVRCIYAIQILFGVDHENGWDILGGAKNLLWSHFPAIIQADGEGFTNEAGYHILWQFSDHATGPWNMALRVGDEWKAFEMELGDQEQRAAFLEGKVPPTAKPVTDGWML